MKASAPLRPGHLAWRAILGPFAHARRRPVFAAAAVALTLVLTLATQVGGAVLWLGLPAFVWAARRARRWGRIAAATSAITLFVAVYVSVSLIAVPPIARALGRAPLPCFASASFPFRAMSPLFCLANRHYAAPSARRLLERLSLALNRRFPGTTVAYLDAGFPFGDGFPLLPHLSHDDGRKVDLALFYRDKRSGKAIPTGGAWPPGYWAFVPPPAGARAACRGGNAWLSLRWDMDWLQPWFADMALDADRTGAMLRWLAQSGERHALGKVLIEPHLRSRFGLPKTLFRFQGCRAARHDDHIHIEMSR